jgi:UrcA family protein
MKTVISLTSSIVLGLIAVNAVHAADPTVTPKSLTVQFADLDLSRTEGVTMLFNRITGAAKSVCSSLRGTSLREKEQHTACVELALTNAVARVDRPVLAQYVSSRSSTETKAPIKIASGR